MPNNLEDQCHRLMGGKGLPRPGQTSNPPSLLPAWDKDPPYLPEILTPNQAMPIQGSHPDSHHEHPPRVLREWLGAPAHGRPDQSLQGCSLWTTRQPMYPWAAALNVETPATPTTTAQLTKET